ncbi:MucR family transcriptional regulator [Arenibaculum sp.]|uniref:MucR family transcriptional regulator n=1 Tax=Arenibaculum sp. TaxID=2865862 RepID=UPI002E107C78|nr:MucR family transcriptional regulator [Arenibaculum sp.]
MQEHKPKSLVELTTQIVAAYAGQHSCPAQDLPGIISTVYSSLAKLGQPEEPVAEQKPPAVSIKKSVTPDYIVCLEDGKKLKMLKRHLRTTYGMTPDEYRAKWGLPRDYPMVAPNYAQRRSEFAKSIGLGRSRKAPEPPPAPAKRGRKKVA